MPSRGAGSRLTLLLLIGLPASVPAQEVRSESTPGLRTTTFATLQGEVVVHLPDDVAAGDRISGTVRAEPAGRTEEERRANTAELSGYVVEVESVADVNPRAEGSGTLTWLVPAAETVAALVLRGPGGEEMARAPIEVLPEPPPIDRPDHPAAIDFRLPEIGQAGSPVVIEGPFDGDFASSSVRVGGVDARPLAESPRQLVVESPPGVVGPTEIVLREGNVEARVEYRSVGVRLSAPKTSLVRGERTTLTVTVEGLQGIDRPVEIALENRSPAVVSMEGGDQQTIVIEPAQVAADGTASVDRALSGVGAGIFTIQAMAPILAGHLHAYETTRTWASRGHVYRQSRDWPADHELDKSIRDKEPEHTDDRSRRWDASGHARATSNRWWAENHTELTSEDWKKRPRPHAYDFSRKWEHRGHEMAKTLEWGNIRGGALSHSVERTQAWQADSHSFVTSANWSRDWHDYHLTREWQVDRHGQDLSKTWNRDRHAYADSRKWLRDGHQYAESLRWE